MTLPLRRVLRAAQPLVPRGSPGVRILAYHLVGAETGSAVDLPSAVFERQMTELASTGVVRSLREATARLASKGAPAGSTVVLTFDDAYANFFDVAWPVLRDLRLPCALFVPTGFVIGERPPPLRRCPDLRPLSWRQLEDLLASGLVELGSHGHSHRRLPTLPDAEIDEELQRPATLLEHRLGVRPEHFGYPGASWNRRVERRVRQVYRTAVIAGGRVNRPGCDLLRLSRIPLRADMSEQLQPLLARAVWLEEWVASKVRPPKP